jgi:hypothetical protein
MARNLDIGLYKNDLFFKDGDFAIVESDEQHVMDTIAAFPGWWKEHPADGVGLFSYLHSAGRQDVLKRNIKINLLSDGYRSDAVTVVSDAAGNVKIVANAEKL